MVRSYQKGKYKYIRNYQPFNFDGLHNFYRYRMLMYQEWRDLYEQGKLNDVQSQFFQARPAEQLFDLHLDPHEVKNLADDLVYQEILLSMRQEFRDHMKEINDLSFIPEPHFLQVGIKNPVQFGRNNKEVIQDLMAIADLQLLPFSAAKPKIKKALHSDHPWVRYWGLIVCSSFGEKAKSFRKKAIKIATMDGENLVRMRAAEF